MFIWDDVQKYLSSEPAYRMKQIKQAVFVDLIDDWQQNSTLPQSMKKQLMQEFSLELKAQVWHSTLDDSIKISLFLEDGCQVESVLLKHQDGRRTVCVSSQVGCSLGCKFCATGKMGFVRNLSADEIVWQVLFFARLLNKEGERVSNVVFMGMGEPFLNYQQVMLAIQMLNSAEMFHIGARHISVSTAGVFEGIQQFTLETLQINLAISLHATTNELRSSLMPINKKYPLEELLKLALAFTRKKSREVMFEYLLIKGVNDTEEDARRLAVLMKHPFFVVNLIRYNNVGDFQSSEFKTIKQFKDILSNEGVKVTQRYSFGQDIQGACGQLAGKQLL